MIQKRIKNKTLRSSLASRVCTKDAARDGVTPDLPTCWYLSFFPRLCAYEASSFFSFTVNFGTGNLGSATGFSFSSSETSDSGNMVAASRREVAMEVCAEIWRRGCEKRIRRERRVGRETERGRDRRRRGVVSESEAMVFDEMSVSVARSMDYR